MKRFLISGLVLVSLFGWANWPDSMPLNKFTADQIILEKGSRTLTLLRDGKTLKSYKISLGRNPMGPKEREGDRKTPEGVYRITQHLHASAFHRALRLSYPEPRDIEHARELGVPPGSDIMIHGIRNGLGWVGRLHRLLDWTQGCIAVTNPEIEEIWNAVPDGTVIDIHE